MNPLVSILSPTYNGAVHIKPFLASVYAQSYSNIELIMVDDGSTDTTAQVIKEYIPKFEERKIKLIYVYQNNKGQASAINLAFSKMSDDAKYFMWVDSDDILLKDNVQHKVDFLEANTEYDLCLCNAILTEYDNKSESKTLSWKKAFNEGSLFENFLFGKNIVAGFGQGTVLVRKELLEKAIPDRKIYESRQGQNWQLMLPFTYYGRAGHLDEVLFKYVIHNDSHSHTKRTFDELIKRFNDFEILLSTTLKNILSMPISEKEKYYKKIHEKYMKEKISLSYSMHHYDFANEIKEKMKKEGFRIPLCFLNVPFNFIYRVCRKCFHIIVVVFYRIKKV